MAVELSRGIGAFTTWNSDVGRNSIQNLPFQINRNSPREGHSANNALVALSRSSANRIGNRHLFGCPQLFHGEMQHQSVYNDCCTLDIVLMVVVNSREVKLVEYQYLPADLVHRAMVKMQQHVLDIALVLSANQRTDAQIACCFILCFLIKCAHIIFLK